MNSSKSKKRVVRAVSTGIALVLTMTTMSTLLSACTDENYDNETSTLVLGTEAVDGAFNPFFYTSGTDGDMVGMTQIGMLTSDDEGQPLAGADEDCVALAYGVVTTGSSSTSREDAYGNDVGYYTDYYFAIKDNIRFSDGEYLTINDVLFNMYMYLDPAYSGSSTMYSVDIQGLSAYRTQTYDASEQEAFEEYFDTEAETRINAIKAWANDDNSTWTDESLASFGKNVKSDIEKAHEYFQEELDSDWNAAPDLVETYQDKYGFTEGWEIFLWEYGLITITKTKNLDGTYTYEIDYNGWDSYAHDQTTMVNIVYEYMLGEQTSASDAYKDNLVSVITYYATASNLRSYLASAAMTEYFADLDGLTVTSISGITTYEDNVIYNEADDGSTETIELGGDYNILKIRINGVDPKAIQNFSFTVAPGHYYSSTWSQFSLASGNEYFGVEFADVDFMTEVKTINVPLGAGAYRASYLNDTGEDNSYIPSKSEFLYNNVIYFTRNNYFHLGTPKIKKINYKVLSSSTMYDSIDAGEVDYTSPQATQETITKLENNKEELGYVLTSNLGYGYIGINANYVHDINVRRAIMYAMDIQMCVDYYGSALAEPIYRPMSKTLTNYYDESWTSYYPYDSTGYTSLQLVQEAGYTTVGSDGVLQNSSGEKLKFTFTIAGDSTDHPAYSMMLNAADILNSVGFDVTVVNDASALSKLSAGTLAVWAAAWSSSSDPDMYQVYHKDSSATSVNAWGYPYLLSEGTAYEINLLNELADLIEEGREHTSVSERAPIYAEALDLVMDLAVELPTYQRRALYVYRNEVIDSSSLYSNPTAYKGPLSELWNVSFVGNDD